MTKQDKIDLIRNNPQHHRGMSYVHYSGGHAVFPTFNKILHNGVFQFTTEFGGDPRNTRFFNVDLDKMSEERINELSDPIEKLLGE